MNLYPIYGHIGFKFFIGFCAFQAAGFATQAAADRRRIAVALERIGNTLERERERELNSKRP